MQELRETAADNSADTYPLPSPRWKQLLVSLALLEIDTFMSKFSFDSNLDLETLHEVIRKWKLYGLLQAKSVDNKRN